MTPLGTDAFFVRTFRFADAIGRPFRIDLQLLSKSGHLNLSQLIGERVAVHVRANDGQDRHFHGMISEVSHTGLSGRYHVYAATIRPEFWFLRQTTNCRIFQGMDVPAIIKQLFEAHAIRHAGFMISKELYPAREYVVQYRESDFNFISRHLEREGLFYVFRHTPEHHEILLSDSVARLGQSVGEITFAPMVAPTDRINRITSLARSMRFRPGVVALADYNYMSTNEMIATKSSVSTAPEASREVFDYPGLYETRAEGEHYSRIRLEQLRVRHESLMATMSEFTLATGNVFRLMRHPSQSLNEREYLVAGTDARITIPEFDHMLSPEDASHEPDSCRHRLIPLATQSGDRIEFRTAPKAKKPQIRGPQTAVVVGAFPAGGGQSEPDEHGRVRVRFFWDRYAQDDGKCSCWIRVSEPWAGKGYGSQHIPHIGHEVIVEFLEGDPDRPIITGRVYNGKNKGYLRLPEEKYRTVVARDHYGNEMIFDGTPGDEHIVLHSPHHASFLSLGYSKWTTTESDTDEVSIGNARTATLGNTVEMVVGSATSLSAGTTFDLFIGAAVEIGLAFNFNAFVGGEFEFKAANSFSVTKGTGFVFSTADEIAVADQDIVATAAGEHNLSGINGMKLVGGGGNAGSPMSMLNLGPTMATLTAGNATDGTNLVSSVNRQVGYAALLGLLAGAAAGAATTMMGTAGMTRLQHEREGDKKKEEAKKWWIAGGVVGAVSLGAAVAQYLYISKVALAAKKDMSTNIITAGLMPRIHLGSVPPTQAAIDAHTAACAATTAANDAAIASHAAACAGLPPGTAPPPPPIPAPMPPAPAGVPAVKLAVGADDVGCSVMLNNLGATVQHGPTNKVEVNMTGVAITVGSTSINATPASATINGSIIQIG